MRQTRRPCSQLTIFPWGQVDTAQDCLWETFAAVFTSHSSPYLDFIKLFVPPHHYGQQGK